MGAVTWIAAAALLRPSPLDVGWAHLLLLLGPLVLVPMGMLLAAQQQGPPAARRLFGTATALQLPSALAFAGAYLLEPGVTAVLLGTPWLVTTALLSLHGLLRVRQHGIRPFGELAIDAGLVYLVVGASWALADRIGYRPLDFDPVIVLLTSIHFHYAGFALPILCGLAARELNARATPLLVIAGVPLVAAGITATQLGLSPVFETAAAWLMAFGGLLTARLYARLEKADGSRVLHAIAAFSLVVSMLLAALYGARFLLPLDWLDIPFMRAVHGTSNALGFALVGMLSWLRPARTSARR